MRPKYYPGRSDTTEYEVMRRIRDEESASSRRHMLSGWTSREGGKAGKNRAHTCTYESICTVCRIFSHLIQNFMFSVSAFCQEKVLCARLQACLNLNVYVCVCRCVCACPQWAGTSHGYNELMSSIKIQPPSHPCFFFPRPVSLSLGPFPTLAWKP